MSSHISRSKGMSDAKRKAYEEEKELLEKRIQALKDNGITPFKNLVDRLNLIESRLNPTKYNNVKVEYDGQIFDSKAEMEFAKWLDSNSVEYVTQKRYVLQGKFKLDGSTVRAITYKLDFLIMDNIAVDVKGSRTEVFNIKWKMFQLKNKDKIKKFYKPSGKKETLSVKQEILRIKVLRENNMEELL